MGSSTQCSPSTPRLIWVHPVTEAWCLQLGAAGTAQVRAPGPPQEVLSSPCLCPGSGDMVGSLPATRPSPPEADGAAGGCGCGRARTGCPGRAVPLLMPIVPRQCALNTLVSRKDNRPQQCCSSWPDTRAQARWTRRRCWRPRAASEEGSRARGSQPLPAPGDWQTPGARAVTTPGPPAGALPGLSAAGSPAAPLLQAQVAQAGALAAT